MNHKRKRPRSQRNGCIMCKWFKDEKFKDTLIAQTIQEKKARIREKEFKKDLSIL